MGRTHDISVLGLQVHGWCIIVEYRADSTQSLVGDCASHHAVSSVRSDLSLQFATHRNAHRDGYVALWRLGVVNVLDGALRVIHGNAKTIFALLRLSACARTPVVPTRAGSRTRSFLVCVLSVVLSRAPFFSRT